MRNQAKRMKLFIQQDNECPLCGCKAKDCVGWAYKPAQHALICKRCNTTLGNYVRGLGNGLTPARMDAFLAQRTTAPVVSKAQPDVILIGGVRCNAVTGEPIE